MRIENYGRNFGFTPRRALTPSSVAELQQLVRSAKCLRVGGALHSWSRGVVTEDTYVSLDRLNAITRVDRDAMQVTVGAGVRLKDLVLELERLGLALANLGSIAEQSLAGAIATGTHGTGIGFKCLADQVQSLSLVDGAGEVRVVDRDHADFDAVVVGLGAFGVVHEMTLSVVPTFQMHAITETMSFDALIDNLDELVRGHDHFKFWWLVPQQQVIVFRQRRTDEPRNDSDFTRWFKDELLGKIAYRSLLGLQRFDRDRMVRLTNRIIGGAYGKRFERICKSHVAFLTPDPPVHAESEWAFDYANAVELLREYRRLLEGNGYSYSFIQEIRFTAGDEFWGSPAYHRDSIWLSHYNIDEPARWDDQLRSFLSFARANDGRPHWGKLANFDAEHLRRCHPRLDDLARVREGYDPDQRFANRWIRKVLGLAGVGPASSHGSPNGKALEI